MLDFDNTIVPYTTNVPTPDMEIWLRCMTRVGVRLCVVSNSKKPRVRVFCQKYGIPCVTHAAKPGTRGIRQAMTEFGVQPSECALVGDQIYTDVVGANLRGVTSILVKSINNHNIWLKARHVLEKPVIYFAGKRRISV
jgi:HAD superfamily phosphatase (TIGR01668 family)